MAQNKGPVIVTLSCEAREGTDVQEIDRAVWDAMTPARREQMLTEMAVDHVNNQGGYGWWIDDPDDADAVEIGKPPDRLRELAEWLVSKDWMLPALRGIEGAPAEVLAEAITRAGKALNKEG